MPYSHPRPMPEKHALCRWQSFEKKGTPVRCHQIVNCEDLVNLVNLVVVVSAQAAVESPPEGRA